MNMLFRIGLLKVFTILRGVLCPLVFFKVFQVTFLKVLIVMCLVFFKHSKFSNFRTQKSEKFKDINKQQMCF